MEEDDHRAGSFSHDLLDQSECVIRVGAETDERHVRPFPGGDRADLLDVDLAGDHLVPECRDDRSDEGQAIDALVRDQDT